MKLKSRRVLLGGGAAGAAALAVVIVAVALILGRDSGDGEPSGLPENVAGLGLDLKPTSADSLGVAPGTTFVLTSGVDLDQSQVKASLRQTPAGDLKVEELSKREFRLRPERELEPGIVIKIGFFVPETGAVAASWAFQIASPLRVVSTLPAHQTAGVPLDTGIEVTFSHDGAINPQANVQIEPAVEGHFEQVKRTLVFVPRALAPATLYTVRVKPGIALAGSDGKLEEETVFQFETGDGRRGGPPQASTTFARKMNETPAAEAPVLVVTTAPAAPRDLPISVYAYRALDRFVADVQALDQAPGWSIFSRDRATVDPAGLDLVTSFVGHVEGVADPASLRYGTTDAYIRFPAALPAGSYLVDSQIGGPRQQAWLQVTDVATYVSVTQTRTLVWVNDVGTGAPLTGARVEKAGGGLLGSTNSQGVAEFDTPAASVVEVNRYGTPLHTGAGLFVVNAGGRQVVVPLGPAFASESGFTSVYAYGLNGQNDYSRFLSTDRPIYQPNDTVHFWGVALVREGAAARDLTVELRESSGSQGVRVGRPISLRTSDLGTFEGQMTLQSLDAGHYYIEVAANGVALTSAYFQVSRYVKPAYRLNTTVSRRAVFEGDTVDIGVEAQFYDGSPVPALELGFSKQTAAGGSLTTDAQGRASLHVTAAYPYPDRSSYANLSYVFGATRAEEGQVSQQSDLIVFPASIAITGSSKTSGGQSVVSGEVARVDLPKFEEGLARGRYPFYAPSSGTRPAYLEQTVPSQSLTIDVTEITYERREVGERYDFVNKISAKVFTYDQRQRHLPSATVSTDAQGRFSYTFASEAGRLYDVTVSTTDPQGRTTTLHISSFGDLLLIGGLSFPYLKVNDDTSLFFGSRTYETGERIRVTFYRGESPAPSGGKSRFLFYEGQRGLRRYTVQDGPEYALTFGDEHIPSVSVRGVAFTGSTYLEAPFEAQLRFNPEKRRLNLDLATAASSYEPGSEATVNVRVTDNNGRPVRAEVNLAAVDEAVFALRNLSDYQGDILSALYAPVPSGVVRTRASHQLPGDDTGPGGRGGDGGDRRDFADIAFFGSIRTDANGQGQVKFKLPDNLTSWRITAYALTDDLKAGRALGAVVVTRPFFVDVSLNRDYLVTDRASVRARVFGTALKGGETVQIKVTAPSLGLTTPATVEVRPFQPADIPLPALTLGTHEVRVEAGLGSMKDAVVRKVDVVASRLVLPKVEFYEVVDAGTRFQGGDEGRTTIVFSDAGRARFFPILQRLQWAYGDRVDQALARNLARGLLKQYFGIETDPEALRSDLYLRTAPRSQRVGVAVLPFADPDLAVTARMAALAPDLFGANTLRAYLQSVADDPRETPERTLIALYGLGSLGDPVLLRLNALKDAPDLGWRGRLYLALGFEAVGDDPSARVTFEAIAKEFGEDLSPYRRLRVGAGQDDILEATALAAILGAGLGDSRTESYLRYVRDNQTRNTLIYLEELTYVKAGLARAGSAPAKFALTLDGKREEVTVEQGRMFALSLSRDQFAGLRFQAVEGRIAASTLYLAPLSGSVPQLSPDLMLVRTYTVGRAPAGPPVVAASSIEVPEGALVAVTLNFQIGALAPDGCYEITDILPSGLKAITTPYDPLLGGPIGPPGFPLATVFPYLSDGQRVSFCVTRSSRSPITYYARVSGKGEFTAEPATIHNQRAPSILNLSLEQKIIVH